MLGLALLPVAHRTLRAIGVWGFYGAFSGGLCWPDIASGIREIVVECIGRPILAATTLS